MKIILTLLLSITMLSCNNDYICTSYFIKFGVTDGNGGDETAKGFDCVYSIGSEKKTLIIRDVSIEHNLIIAEQLNFEAEVISYDKDAYAYIKVYDTSKELVHESSGRGRAYLFFENN